MDRAAFRKELRSLLDHYVFTSRSDAIRLGHIARLSLHFSALASRLGCEVMDDTDDRAAMAAVEGEGVRDAAE